MFITTDTKDLEINVLCSTIYHVANPTPTPNLLSMASGVQGGTGLDRQWEEEEEGGGDDGVETDEIGSKVARWSGLVVESDVEPDEVDGGEPEQEVHFIRPTI